MNEMPPDIAKKITDAIGLVRITPGYASEAQELAQLLADGKIRYHAVLDDRAHTGLTGNITLGPEPFEGGATLLGLAETLVHERFHIHQSPLDKTASFWTGVFTKSDAMIRYERPAYQAAQAFLEAYKAAHPQDLDLADAELYAVRATFQSNYNELLS